MAQYSKKRARELQKDRFRDTTMERFDRLGKRLKGHERTILYISGGVVAFVVLLLVWSWWSNRRAEEARLALGKAIEIAEAPVTPSPSPGATTPSFPNERERAQKAVEEFQKVAAKYGDPYRDLARYFTATNLLTLDRSRGLKELEDLSKSGNHEIAARAKFALAEALENDGQYDRAIALDNDLAKAGDPIVPADTVNLRLAGIYEKQGKKDEAANILFHIVEASRKAQDTDGKPVPPSAAARDAAQKLQTLDPARYAQLPPEPALGNPLLGGMPS